MNLKITSLTNTYDRFASTTGEEVSSLREVTIGFSAPSFSGELTFESNRIYGFDSPMDEIVEMLKTVLIELDKDSGK